MKDQRPDEALDACRRDPVDLEWPEMRDLAARLDREPELRAVFQERLEQDELIAARLRSVALSGTSRARLSERIQLAIADCQPTIGPPAIQSTDLPVKGRRLFRAMHVVAAIAVSAAVLLFVGWAVYPGRWAHVGARELAHWALRDWQPTSGQWQRMPLRNPDEGRAVFLVGFADLPRDGSLSKLI